MPWYQDIVVGFNNNQQQVPSRGKVLSVVESPQREGPGAFRVKAQLNGIFESVPIFT